MDIMELQNELYSMSGNVKQVIENVMALMLVPMLINCFFGYKIQKFMVTLGGAAFGALLGFILAIASMDETTIILSVLVLGVLCGFISYKLYRLGIFLYYWLLGILLFAAVFLMTDAYNMIGFSVVMGLLVGVLALILHKGFIIVITAFSGGMAAGRTLAMLVHELSLGPVFGVVISLLGIIVQFYLEKKTSKPAGDAKRNTADAVQNADTQIHQTVNDSKAEQAMPLVAETNPFTELWSEVPNYYCSKSKVLMDSVRLLKDNDNQSYIYIDFHNIGSDTLIAVYFCIIGYDIAGEQLGEETYSVIDIRVEPDSYFHSGKIKLFDSSIRRAEVIITQIVKSDYEVVKFQREDTLILPERQMIRDSIHADILELLDLKKDEKYIYVPLEDGLWFCTCGTIGYKNCPSCGRTSEQSLKDLDSAVIDRIASNIHQLTSDIETAKTTQELKKCKDKTDGIMALLVKHEFDEKLLEACRAALPKIQLREKELQIKNEQMKNRAKKIALVAAGIMAVIAVINFFMGLPPSNSRVKSDVKEYLAEHYGENYSVKDVDIVYKEKGEYSFYAEIEASAKDKKNKDILDFKANLSYYKEDGKYPDNFSLYVEDASVYSNHEIGKEDRFMYPQMNVKLGTDDWWKLDEAAIEQLEADGALKVTFDVASADVKEEGRVVSVPVEIQLTYLNASSNQKLDIEYWYTGDYSWECVEFVDLILEAKGNVLDENSIYQILAEKNIEYQGEMLSCKYLNIHQFDVEYSDGYTKAVLKSDAAWDNGMVRLDGSIDTTFELVDGVWKVQNFQFLDSSEAERYSLISDEEIINILYPVILEKCSEKTNVSNLTIMDKRRYSDGTNICVQYESTNGNYILKNEIVVTMNESILQGYTFKELREETVVSAKLAEEIHEVIEVHYQLETDESTPIGVPYSGDANLTLDVDSDCNAALTGSFGDLSINLSGKLQYQDGAISLSLSQEDVDIYVEYHLLVWVEKEISHNIAANLSYQEGSLQGRLYLNTIAAGVDDFSIVIE